MRMCKDLREQICNHQRKLETHSLALRAFSESAVFQRPTYSRNWNSGWIQSLTHTYTDHVILAKPIFFHGFCLSFVYPFKQSGARFISSCHSCLYVNYSANKGLNWSVAQLQSKTPILQGLDVAFLFRCNRRKIYCKHIKQSALD